MRDANALLRQPLGVGLPLVPERVVLGREHHRGRHAGERAGAQRRGIRVRARRGVGRVVIPEPRHRVAAHDQLVGGIEVGVPVEIAVGHRIHEHLQRDLESSVTGPLRHDCRQASAGAVAGDDQRHGAARDLLDVRRGPLQRRPRVLDGCRIAMLRSEAIVDQDHRAAAAGREPAAERVELIERAEDPPAAVVVDDHAAAPLGGNEKPSAVDVLHAQQLGPPAVELGHPGARRPSLLRAQLVQWRQTALRQRGDEARARLIQHSQLLRSTCSVPGPLRPALLGERPRALDEVGRRQQPLGPDRGRARARRRRCRAGRRARLPS